MACLALFGLLLAGCTDKNSNAETGLAPPPPVRVVTVAQRDMPYPQSYVGKTAGSREVEVRARVDGILLRRVYVEGAFVEQGDLMFEIEPETSRAVVNQMSGDLHRLRADLNMARLNKQRLVQLFEEGAVSAQEKDDAVTSFDAAVASVDAAEARLKEASINLGYTEVRAPISGITSIEARSEGNLVKATEASGKLTTITQLDPLYVNFSIAGTVDLKMRKYVEEGILALPKEGYEVRLKLPDGSMFPRSGVINFRDTHVSTTTGAIRCRAEFDNPDTALLPGEIVRVQLYGAVLKNVITAPQSAVLFTQQGAMVFVVDGNQTVHARPVKLGDALNGDYLVPSGLAPGERIVSEGVVKVRNSAAVTVLPNAPPREEGRKEVSAKKDEAE